MVKTVGILALQGAVAEHAEVIKNCGQQPLLIKKPSELSLIDGLIIPGGESTAIGKLLVKYEFVAPLKKLIKDGLPVFGSCAGLILLAKEVVDGIKQPLLGLMNMQVRRNAFGRQVESFETELAIANWSKPFKAVFIRAPWIEKVGPTVKILASYNGKAVLAEEKNMLAAAFHPELTNDLRLHQYFLSKVR